MDKPNPITPLDPQETVKEEKQAAKEGWFHRVLVQIDILGNVLLFRGQANETISSHAARASLQGKRWGKVLSAMLDVVEKDHGAKAIAGDEERAKNIERIEGSTGVLQ